MRTYLHDAPPLVDHDGETLVLHHKGKRFVIEPPDPDDPNNRPIEPPEEVVNPDGSVGMVHHTYYPLPSLEQAWEERERQRRPGRVVKKR